MTALSGNGKKILMIAVFALHPSKAVMQVAAVKIDYPKVGVSCR
jgi:hypothetical protein